MKISVLSIFIGTILLTLAGCESENKCVHKSGTSSQVNEKIKKQCQTLENNTKNTNGHKDRVGKNINSSLVERVQGIQLLTDIINHSIDQPSVEVEKVTFESLPSIKEFSAVITPNQQVEVHPLISGTVSEVMFKKGDLVKKGDVLYRLESQQILASISTSKSAIKQAKAQLTSAQTAHRKAKAMLRTNQSILKQARADLDRYEILIKDDAVSEQTYQQAITNVETSQSSLKSTQALIIQTEADITTAQANIKHTKNKLLDEQKKLDQIVVDAPISGKIVNANIREGQKVTIKETDALIEIAQTQPIFADIELSTDQFITLTTILKKSDESLTQNEVKLVLPNNESYAQSGTFTFMEAYVNDKDKIMMRVLFPNEENLLLPDMKVTAQVSLLNKTRAVLLPADALVFIPLKNLKEESIESENSDYVYFVYILDGNGRIHRREVKIDGMYQDKVVVTQGLKVGDNVVISHNKPLVDKQRVIIQKNTYEISPLVGHIK